MATHALLSGPNEWGQDLGFKRSCPQSFRTSTTRRPAPWISKTRCNRNRYCRKVARRGEEGNCKSPLDFLVCPLVAQGASLGLAVVGRSAQDLLGFIQVGDLVDAEDLAIAAPGGTV